MGPLTITLDAGQQLRLEAQAGRLILMIQGQGLRPAVACLTSEQCAQLIDLLGLFGVVAEDQAFELDYLTALAAAGLPVPPRELQASPEGADTTEYEIPAFLRREAGGCHG